MSDNHDNWKKIHINRARSYSKRHNCTVQVRLCVKGRGKGRYNDYTPGEIDTWWTDSVCKVVAVYKNGVKLK